MEERRGRKELWHGGITKIRAEANPPCIWMVHLFLDSALCLSRHRNNSVILIHHGLTLHRFIERADIEPRQ